MITSIYRIGFSLLALMVGSAAHADIVVELPYAETTGPISIGFSWGTGAILPSHPQLRKWGRYGANSTAVSYLDTIDYSITFNSVGSIQSGCADGASNCNSFNTALSGTTGVLCCGLEQINPVSGGSVLLSNYQSSPYSHTATAQGTFDSINLRGASEPFEFRGVTSLRWTRAPNFSNSATPGEVTGIHSARGTTRLREGKLVIETKIYPKAFADDEIYILVTGINSAGNNAPISEVARKMGYNHFNFIQIILTDPDVAAGASGYRNYAGNIVNLPTYDPPSGGWAYERQRAGAPIGTRVGDSLPFYWDEQYSGYTRVTDARSQKQEALSKFVNWRNLDEAAILGTRPSTDANRTALGQLFYDRPRPPSQGETRFVTLVVGVKFDCVFGAIGAVCPFEILPNTFVSWSVIENTNGPGDTTIIINDDLKTTVPSEELDLGSLVDGVSVAPKTLSEQQFLQYIGWTAEQLITIGGSFAQGTADITQVGEYPAPSSLANAYINSTVALKSLYGNKRGCIVSAIADQHARYSAYGPKGGPYDRTAIEAGVRAFGAACNQ